MKKPTIKELQHQIEHLEHTRDDYYRRFTKAESALEEVRREERMGLRKNLDVSEHSNRQLFEIVRWLVNRETALDPFNESKGLNTYKNY